MAKLNARDEERRRSRDVEASDRADYSEALERGLLVLAAFERDDERLTQARLARKLGLPRATVRRALLTLTHLSREDYVTTGADESYSEGVVDHLRALEGTAVAGLVRDQLSDGTPARKVSLRATDDRIDVSRIARAGGGGGHRRAAGFSTDLDFPALVEFLRAQVANQL